MNTQLPEARLERRVAINSSLLLMAYGFQAVISLVIVGVVARYLGQAGLGRYAFIISFIELFTTFADMGMSRILVREIARNRAEATRLTSAIWTLRLALSLLTLLLVGIITARNGDGLWIATMAFLLSQVIYLLGDVFAAAFQGYQRMEHQFWSLIISQVVMLLATLLAVWLDLGLLALFAARILANSTRLAYVWWISARRGFAEAHVLRGVFSGGVVLLRSLPGLLSRRRRVGRAAAMNWLDEQGRHLAARWQEARLAAQLLVESLPVGISLVLQNYIWRGGVVLTVLWLGQQQGDLVNGVLYGPLRAVQQIRIIPGAFAAAMLPVFSDRATTRRADFDTAFAKTIKLFTAISLLISLAFTFLADPLVRLLLGSDIDLSMAAAVMATLGWVVALYFPNWLYGATLVALGKQRIETLGLALGLLMGALVAWWGIPRFGALGVVYGILAAEGSYFVVGTLAMRDHFHWRTLGLSLLKIVLSCLLAGVVFWLSSGLWQRWLAAGRVPSGDTGAIIEVLVVGLLGLCAFFTALLLQRTFNDDEREAIRAMLRLR
ncbi:MAG: oligosaccharide flippase family protein [Caldilineales bacterium]